MMAITAQSEELQLTDLLDGIAVVPDQMDREITGLTLDSRQAAPGWLFLACRGKKRHGLDFSEQAVTQGAAAIVWEPDEAITEAQARSLEESLSIPFIAVPELSAKVSLIAGRFFHDPSRQLFMVGITGTNGKTSVSHLLAQALQPTTRCAIVGTLGVGYAESLTATGYTTPDAVTLQQLLAQLKADGAQAVAMEVSSHALDQGRADAVHFDTAVFTNISRDHFDYHGSMENYTAAKRRLFLMPDLRSAVVNLDDPWGRELLMNIAKDVRIWAYSLEPNREIPQKAAGWVRAESIVPTAQGLQISLSSHLGEGIFHSNLLGSFNAANLLAVLLVLLDQGWPLPDALQGLEILKTVEGRMERYGDDALPAVVIDYAHTPDALDKALSALRCHCAQKLWVVFGCGGDRDRGKRSLMGGVAARLADRVVLTDDNPRTEPGDRIIAEILAGIQQGDRVSVQRDRSRAIHQTIDAAGPEDLVLVAGKGHEDYQLVAGEVLHFSDREEVLSALANWRGET
ncbi:MAG: UDP-N-acetylmuramoyl-L-alanyl-D-glutamate--2,6-diaminopimelate ligase [Gammaproteobacteria bacterium]|nr:UDP-N-acetylmuramoyl-L-alanyl-D-glutamate--2,6-diaminopimelate ligase [Gammaproteobacteria bacterium]